MSPIIVDKKNKQKEILAAALRVFSKLGIPNTKMIDIANEAGIGKGTIYEYFRSKDEVIQETIRSFLAKMDSVEIEQDTSAFTSIEKVIFIIDGWVDILLKDPLEARVIIDMWAENIRRRNDKEMINLQELYKKYRDYIMSILDEGIKKGEIRSIDSEAMSAVIAAAMDGLYLHWIIGEDLINIEKAVSEFKTTIIHYLQQ